MDLTSPAHKGTQEPFRGGLQGQNSFHNIKMFFAFPTMLTFALVLCKQ